MSRGRRRPAVKGLRSRPGAPRFLSAPPRPLWWTPEPWWPYELGWLPPGLPETKPWTEARSDWLLSRRGRMAWKRVIRCTPHYTSADPDADRHGAERPYWRNVPGGWSYGHLRRPWWTSLAVLPFGWPTARRRERAIAEPTWDGTIW